MCNEDYYEDPIFGQRLLISRKADQTELTSNIRAARAILQGCKIVVIDLDEHIFQVRAFELSEYISRRKADFTSGMITDCYVVFDGNAVRVNARYQTRIEIQSKIEMLKP